MRTPNVFCASCHKPLGTGSPRDRHFCDEHCARVWPGVRSERNARIHALYYGGAMYMQEIANLYGLSLRRVKGIVHGK